MLSRAVRRLVCAPSYDRVGQVPLAASFTYLGVLSGLTAVAASAQAPVIRRRAKVCHELLENGPVCTSLSEQDAGTTLRVHDEVARRLHMVTESEACGLATSPGNGGDVPKGSLPRPRMITVGGFDFADRRELSGSTLIAKGRCHLTYWTLQVASAVLYMKQDTRAATGRDVTNPAEPKELSLIYLRGITGEQFRSSTRDIIRAQNLLTPPVQSALERFNRLYRDVRHGDKYTLQYEPHAAEGAVTRLWLNDQLLGSVVGEEFSEALFSVRPRHHLPPNTMVWFGGKPFMEKLKVDLLSGVGLPC